MDKQTGTGTSSPLIRQETPEPPRGREKFKWYLPALL